MHHPMFTKFTLTVLLFSILLSGCISRLKDTPTEDSIMTVNGWVSTSEMGTTLTHEHLFADLRTFEEQRANPINVETDEVIRVVLPYLQTIRNLGCKTFVDATATHLGRNPALIKALSDASGLHMLTVTGVYLAADGRFIPDYARTETAEELAARWISEWKIGIEGTGIKPGFIKISFNGGPMTPLEKKILQAAILTHRATGLTIGSHIGHSSEQPGYNGQVAMTVLNSLKLAGVSPRAWIWIHAQNEKDLTYSLKAASAGAYVSFDGFRPEEIDKYVEVAHKFFAQGIENRLLFSQDAGWYNPDAPNGGTLNPYDPILRLLVPSLHQKLQDQNAVDQIFVKNPASAFAVSVKLL